MFFFSFLLVLRLARSTEIAVRKSQCLNRTLVIVSSDTTELFRKIIPFFSNNFLSKSQVECRCDFSHERFHKLYCSSPALVASERRSVIEIVHRLRRDMTHVTLTQKIVVKIASVRITVAEIAVASRECGRMTVCGGDIAAVMSPVHTIRREIAVVRTWGNAICC